MSVPEKRLPHVRGTDADAIWLMQRVSRTCTHGSSFAYQALMLTATGSRPRAAFGCDLVIWPGRDKTSS